MAQKLTVTANMDLSDPAQESLVPLDERWYDRIFSDCRKHSLQRVYWRISLGRAYYRSKVLTPISREGNSEKRIHTLSDMIERSGPDPLEMAVSAAHENGVQLIAWFPFNEAYYFNPGTRYLVDPWYAERTHLFWSDRSGDRRWMGMPCIAEPEVVDHTREVVEELCGYDVDGVYMVPRTHCYTPFTPDQKSYEPEQDEFGFNEPIRQRCRDQLGVDICSDDFEVAAWQRIKGEFYTEFLASCASEAHRHNKILLAGTLPFRLGYAPSSKFPEALRIRNDWRSWFNQAGVDGIVSIQERVRLPGSAEFIPDEKIGATTRDAGIIVEDAPGCPVHVFHPILAFRPVSGGSWCLLDRILEPVSILEKRRDLAVQQGACELILHEGYVPLFLDTQGQDPGIGPCPKAEYWQAIERWNRGHFGSAV